MDSTSDPPVDASALHEAAVRLLARREHTRTELETKLGRRFPQAEPELVERVLDELAASGFQSDRRYAESFVRQRAEKGYGPVRIRAELRQRGVDDATGDAALAALNVDFFDLAASVYARRYGRSGAPEDRRERARRYQAMGRRGFSGDHLREIDELNG